MTTTPEISAVPLENHWVALEPLGPEHFDGLEAAAADPEELFRWLLIWQPGPTGLRAALERFVQALRNDPTMVSWVIRRRLDARIVGSTSYLDIDAANRRVEIGATWIGQPWWRTEVNTATKILLLSHAFDMLGMERVALKTDHLNVRSQRAIERLGAVREGALRHHVLRADGTWRDTVYYSILASEWPHVRDWLAKALTSR